MSHAKQTVEKLLALADVKINGSRPWDMQVHDERTYARILKEGSLGLGESFMDGWWTCEALDQFICNLLKADLESKVKQNWTLAFQLLFSKLFNQQSHARSKKVAEVHYMVICWAEP